MKSTLVSFVIPYAPKSRCDYWSTAMRNAVCNLNSILNQTNDRYEIILGISEEDLKDLDILFPDTMKLPRIRRISVVNNTDQWSTDKDNKTYAMLKESQGKYVLRSDWDDLFHRDLVQYVEDHEVEHGLMITKGYYFKSPRLILPLNKFNEQCGSCHLIAYDNEERQGKIKHTEDHDMSLFHHQYIDGYRAEIDRPLTPITERYGMYYIHDNNISHDKHLRTLAKADWQPMSQEIINDFF